MIHVLLRIGVWVVVFAIGYLVFGPKLFDSFSHDESPQSTATLYLPPPKPQRLVELEGRLKAGGLDPNESVEYQSLAKQWQASFWKGDGLTVEQALSGVKDHRRERLAAILAERGLSGEELSFFFMAVQRDHPSLLEDPD
jgi:hypothetical protein